MAPRKAVVTGKELTESIRTFNAKVRAEASVDNKPSKAAEIGMALSKMTTLCSTGKREVAALLSVVVGEKITVVKGGGECYPAGTIFVCLSKTNGHNYPPNKPILAYGDSHAVQFSGMMGNQYPRAPKVTRLATEEEVESFIKGLLCVEEAGCLDMEYLNDVYKSMIK